MGKENKPSPFKESIYPCTPVNLQKASPAGVQFVSVLGLDRGPEEPEFGADVADVPEREATVSDDDARMGEDEVLDVLGRWSH